MTGGAAARGPAIAAFVLLGACTEPNPYLPAADASTGTSTSAASDATTLATSGTTPASGSDGSSGGEPSCVEQGMTCVAAAPEGFLGPFAWLERPVDAPMRCSTPFPQQLVEAFSELSAPAASCDCECGPFGNADCGPASVDHHSGAACGGAAQATLDLDPGCNLVGGSGWTSTSFFFDAPAVVGGGCVPLPALELQPAAFLTRHLACAGTQGPEGCGAGQLCVPLPIDPYHARLCVSQVGDVACPEGSTYAERTLLHRNIDDQRGCEQCTCTAPQGPCEGTSAVLSSSFNCAVVTAGVAPDGCVGGFGGANIQSVYYVEGEPTGECEPAVVVPTGDAAGIDPITFCCAP